MKDWTFTKCVEFNPLHEKANKLGFVYFWRGYNKLTGQYVIGDTKNEAINKAKQAK